MRTCIDFPRCHHTPFALKANLLKFFLMTMSLLDIFKKTGRFEFLNSCKSSVVKEITAQDKEQKVRTCLHSSQTAQSHKPCPCSFRNEADIALQLVCVCVCSCHVSEIWKGRNLSSQSIHLLTLSSGILAVSCYASDCFKKAQVLPPQHHPLPGGQSQRLPCCSLTSINNF